MLLCEKLFLANLLKKLPRFVGHVYTLFVIVFAGALFGFEDIRRGFSFIKVLFGGGAGLINDATRYQLLSYAPLLVICAVASTPLVAWIGRKIAAVNVRHRFREGLLTACDSLRLLGLSALSLAYLISGSYNPFLYFRF